MRSGIKWNNKDGYVWLVCKCYEMTQLARHSIADLVPKRCFIEYINLFRLSGAHVFLASFPQRYDIFDLFISSSVRYRDGPHVRFGLEEAGYI